MASVAVSLQVGAPLVIMEKVENITTVASRLKNAKSTELPPNYFFPASEAMGSTITSAACGTSDLHLSLPVIDLGGITMASGDPDPAVRKELAQQIGKAASEWGFFQVVNHGCSEATVKALYQQVREFFELPVDVKERAENPLFLNSGYRGRAEQQNKKVLWLEFLSQKYRPSPAVESLAAQIWPDGNPAFCTAVHEFCRSIEKLGPLLMGLLAESLGLKASEFSRHLEDPNLYKSALRLHHYPACPDPSHAVGSPAHSDSGFLTIVKQDVVGGLQVKKGDSFLNVTPIDGAFVVNVGDTTKVLSNGRLPSAQHQVVLNEKFGRISMIYQFNAGDDMLIESPKDLIDETHPSLYIPFTGHEFQANYVKHARDKNIDKWIAFARRPT